jgi:molecular chaperone GrpE
MSHKEEKQEKKKVDDLEKELQTLHEQVRSLEEEKQQIFEQLQRVSADYTNYQKRIAKQIAESVAYEKKMILRSLLPSLDNFEHAFAGIGTGQGEESLQKMIEGIRLIYDHMLDTLKSHGVEKIDAMGKSFSPDLHEAVMQREEADKENNTILEVYQSGYTLGGQVLRPAKVIVNRLPEKSEESVPKDRTASDGHQED